MYAKDFNITKQWVENIIQNSNTVTASASWANGDDKTIAITTTSRSGAILLTEPNVSIYIDSVATDKNLLGPGTTFDMSTWQVIGPFFDYDTTGEAPVTSVTKIRIRNISAGTHTLIAKVKVRLIQNSVTVTGTAA